MTFDAEGLTKKFNRAGTEYYVNDKDEIEAKKCTKCSKLKSIGNYVYKPVGLGGRGSKCRQCAKRQRLLGSIKYRESRYGIKSKITEGCVEEVLSKFDSRCALTGDESIHMDHVIPLSLGREGRSRKGNLIPLSSFLNMNKGIKNIFEWFEDNRERFGLEQRKFDELIEYLADINDMTTEEYEEYVRWCHDNPRDLPVDNGEGMRA